MAWRGQIETHEYFVYTCNAKRILAMPAARGRRPKPACQGRARSCYRPERGARERLIHTRGAGTGDGRCGSHRQRGKTAQPALRPLLFTPGSGACARDRHPKGQDPEGGLGRSRSGRVEPGPRLRGRALFLLPVLPRRLRRLGSGGRRRGRVPRRTRCRRCPWRDRRRGPKRPGGRRRCSSARRAGQGVATMRPARAGSGCLAGTLDRGR